MVAQVAYTKKVQVSSNGTTWYTLNANTATLNAGGTVLDDSVLGATSPWRSSMYGLRDWSLDMTLLYDTSDAGFTLVRDAALNRTTLYMKYLPDGSSGFQANSAVVESFNMTGGVDELETVSVTMRSDAALTTV